MSRSAASGAGDGVGTRSHARLRQRGRPPALAPRQQPAGRPVGGRSQREVGQVRTVPAGQRPQLRAAERRAVPVELVEPAPAGQQHAAPVARQVPRQAAREPAGGAHEGARRWVRYAAARLQARIAASSETPAARRPASSQASTASSAALRLSARATRSAARLRAPPVGRLSPPRARSSRTSSARQRRTSPGRARRKAVRAALRVTGGPSGIAGRPAAPAASRSSSSASLGWKCRAHREAAFDHRRPPRRQPGRQQRRRAVDRELVWRRGRARRSDRRPRRRGPARSAGRRAWKATSALVVDGLRRLGRCALPSMKSARAARRPRGPGRVADSPSDSRPSDVVEGPCLPRPRSRGRPRSRSSARRGRRQPPRCRPRTPPSTIATAHPDLGCQTGVTDVRGRPGRAVAEPASVRPATTSVTPSVARTSADAIGVAATAARGGGRAGARGEPTIGSHRHHAARRRARGARPRPTTARRSRSGSPPRAHLGGPGVRERQVEQRGGVRRGPLTAGMDHPPGGSSSNRGAR